MGIELDYCHEKVPFDHAAAQTLIDNANAAVNKLNDQQGLRVSWRNEGARDFRGYFAERFADNGQSQQKDHQLLVSRLGELASGVRRLKDEADKEQQRRNKAKEWVEHRKHRDLVEQITDWFKGEERPPVGPPATPITINNFMPAVSQRTPPAPGAAGETSSARPTALNSFASNYAQADDALVPVLSALKAAHAAFIAGCRWGKLDATSTLNGFASYIQANREDARWATTVAAAFERAGTAGGIGTLSNQTLSEILRANNLSATRDPLTIDPAQVFGAKPTTGYANDPVNTATGNFLEPEIDLSFPVACETLEFTRCYNSLNQECGAFGVGWSSWTETKLVFADDKAIWVLPDGRQIFFPREGKGWDRAVQENYWLEKSEQQFIISGNDGRRWEFEECGRLIRFGLGEFFMVTLSYTNDQLSKMMHDRGRSITIEWTADRVAAIEADDGRRVTYRYDDQGRLTAASGPAGTRQYRWNERNLIETVVAATGVVEATNTYDDQGRVVEQISAFSRVTKFDYMPGFVTTVADKDGTRNNTYVCDDKARLIRVSDAHGELQTRAYDRWNNLVSVVERDGSMLLAEFDSRGRRSKMCIPSGAIITFSYDDHDRPLAIQADDGEQLSTLRYEYDTLDRNPSRLIDPEGGITHYVWEQACLQELIDPTGVRTTFTYTAQAEMATITNSLGHTYRINYDPAGNPIEVITPTGSTTKINYDAAGHVNTVIDPLGYAWHYTYNAAGEPTAITDPLGNTQTFEYGTHGELIKTIDALGRVTSQTFDELGNLVARIEADGSEWRFHYDDLSRLTELGMPNGGVWRQTYDAAGALNGICDPTGVSVHGSYTAHQAMITSGADQWVLRDDKRGLIVSETAPDGSNRLTRFDRCGRPIEQVDGQGNTTKIERDGAGRVITVQQPDGGITRYCWDQRGLLASMTDPMGYCTKYEYDPDNRLIRQINAAGVGFSREYDAMGRVVCEHISGRGTYHYRYDARGLLTAVRDPVHGHRRFRYDQAGQLIEAVAANGGITRYGYDQGGRVTSITDPLGNTTQRSYDALGNLIKVTDPLGRSSKASFDQSCRLLSMDEPTGVTTRWNYDERGRIESVIVDGEVTQILRSPQTRQMKVVRAGEVHELEWNTHGRLVRRSRNGKAVGWHYDAAGNVVAIMRPNGLTTRLIRDLNGRIISINDQGRQPVSLSYDEAGQLVEVIVGDQVQRWHYVDGFLSEYQTGSDLIKIARNDAGLIESVTTNGKVTCYSYDDAGQLTSYGDQKDQVAVSYDLAGRIIAEHAPGSTTSYHYDAASQLLSCTKNDQTIRYSYNELGQRTKEDGQQTVVYQWSATGWLSGVTIDGDHTKIGVDALGELANVNGVEFFWDATDQPAPGPLQIADESVLRGPGITGIGATWAEPGFRIQRSASVDPWDVHPVAARQPIQIGAGGEVLIGSLEWLQSRVYQPSSRSFLASDPVPATPGAGWAANPYEYAGNNPIHLLDPAGLKPLTDADLDQWKKEHGSNWEYVVGGAAIVGGIALCFVPIPGAQILGANLAFSGLDVVVQKATKGSVDWESVAVGLCVGLATGGAGEVIGTAAKGGMALWKVLGLRAVNGVVNDEVSYLSKNRGHYTWQGAAGAGASGLITGVAGHVINPVKDGVKSGILNRLMPKSVPRHAEPASQAALQAVADRTAKIGQGLATVGVRASAALAAETTSQLVNSNWPPDPYSVFKKTGKSALVDNSKIFDFGKILSKK